MAAPVKIAMSFLTLLPPAKCSLEKLAVLRASASRGIFPSCHAGLCSYAGGHPLSHRAMRITLAALRSGCTG
eukprot:3021163-Heterocapsa_arctica.AAC.1